MARTLGVELSPGRCCLVELTRRGGRVRLKRFVSIDAGSDEPERLAGDLRRVRRERGLPKRARAVVWSSASLVPTLDGDHRDRVEALRLAGFSLDATASPPEALSTLDATLGRDTRAAAAHLAVNPDGAALAVVRSGELLIGHEFDWSALEDPRRPDRRALGRRLGAAVQRVLLDAGAAGGEIDRITLCGSLPQLRALTQPLGEALGRPVEVLDTIEGVDTAALDVPILELQRDLAGLRLAWAMAAGAVSRAPRSGAPRAWMRPVAAAVFLTAAAAATLFACWPREWAPTVARQEITSPAPVRVPVVQTPPAPVAPIDLPATAPQAVRQPPESAPPPLPPAPREVRPVSPRPRAAPPDWRVRSILVSTDRQLAIIDGRIVGPGDRVGRDVVIDIGEREVTFADAAGREGRVQLWEARPGVIVR
jgi:hypothetical protein